VNHSFIASAINSEICAKCKKDLIAHSNMAECESCSNIGPVELVYGNMLMCSSCIIKEKVASSEHMSPEKQAERVAEFNEGLAKARLIDDAIKVRTDVFNAETVSIIDLKKLIDEDTSIINKPYALAEELMRRFNQHKAAIFEHNEAIITETNAQRAIQININELANKLRAEEREKLRISDINYKPVALRPSKPSSIKVSKKLDKKELKKYATELGIGEFTLQMVAVQRGISIELAAEILRKSINEAKLQSTNPGAKQVSNLGGGLDDSLKS
jgi:hypothetical protein